MQVRDNECVYRRFAQTEGRKPITQCLTSGFPVGAAVDEEKPSVRLDRVGVDPRR